MRHWSRMIGLTAAMVVIGLAASQMARRESASRPDAPEAVAAAPAPASPAVPVAAADKAAPVSEGKKLDVDFKYTWNPPLPDPKWQESETSYGCDSRWMGHTAPKSYGGGVASEIKKARSVMRWTAEQCSVRAKGRLLKELALAKDVKGEKVPGRKDCVVYRGTYENVDERFTLRNDGGVEHDIVLAKRPENLPPDGDLAFSGRLELSGGATLWVDNQQVTSPVRTRKAIMIKSLDGTEAAYMHQPVAYDKTVTSDIGGFQEKKALQKPGHNTYPEYEVEMLADGSYRLSVNTSVSWLARKSIEYPVVIDPFLAPLGPDAFGYVGSTDNQVQNIATFGSHVLGIGGSGYAGMEDGFINIPVGDPRISTNGTLFNFWYYGIPLAPCPFPCILCYPTITPHVNGYLSFIGSPRPPIPCGNTNPPDCTVYPPGKDAAEFSNGPIPTGGLPIATIFGLWDDLVFRSSSSGVYLFTQGGAPYRQMIWQWHDMGFYYDPGHAGVDFAIVLNETYNTIFIQFGAGFPDPGQASTGIQDCSGTIGIMANFNSPITAPARVSFKVNNPPRACPWLHPDSEPFVVDSAGAPSTWDHTCPTAAQPIIPRVLVACAPIKLTFAANRLNPPSYYATDVDGDVLSYRWQFRFTPDPVEQASEAYAPIVSYEFKRPGMWNIDLTVSDSFGSTPTGPLNSVPPPPPFTIQLMVYRAPDVTEAMAIPSGGAAPLDCIFRVKASVHDNVFEEIRATPVAPTCSEIAYFYWDFGDGSPIVQQAAKAVRQTTDPSNGLFEQTAPPRTYAPADDPGYFPPVDWIGVGSAGTGVTPWAPATPKALGDRVGPSSANGYMYECIVAGTTNNIEPVWPTLLGATALDGTVTWRCITEPGDITHQYTAPGAYVVRAAAVGIGTTIGNCRIRIKEFVVYVSDPANWTTDRLLVTDSTFKVDWAERIRTIERIQNCGRNNNRAKNPPDPWELASRFDSLRANGFINLPGYILSELEGKHLRFQIRTTRVYDGVTFANPYVTLYQGPLDAAGKVEVVDPNWGRQGTFQYSLPNGAFKLSLVRQYLANPDQNGFLNNPIMRFNATEDLFLPVLLRFDIGTYTPGGVTPPSFVADTYSGEVMLSYQYKSTLNKTAQGRYRFGSPRDQNRTQLESGVILVTDATLRPSPSDPTKMVVKLEGALSRPGGDSIRPTSGSDFIVQIGGFNETLNTATSPKWSASGKPPRTKVSFNRDDTLGRIGLRRMTFAGYGGKFSIETWPVSTATLGIDTTVTSQTVPLRIVINTDNNRVLDARTTFEVRRDAGDDSYTH